MTGGRASAGGWAPATRVAGQPCVTLTRVFLSRPVFGPPARCLCPFFFFCRSRPPRRRPSRRCRARPPPPARRRRRARTRSSASRKSTCGTARSPRTSCRTGWCCHGRRPVPVGGRPRVGRGWLVLRCTRSCFVFLPCVARRSFRLVFFLAACPSRMWLPPPAPTRARHAPLMSQKDTARAARRRQDAPRCILACRCSREDLSSVGIMPRARCSCHRPMRPFALVPFLSSDHSDKDTSDNYSFRSSLRFTVDT